MKLKLSFVIPLLWDVDLKIEIALCMNDFLCSSIFTDIPFFHFCVFSFLFVIHFVSSLFLGCLLFSNVDLAMGVIEIYQW